ncbi:hypothetical protein N802_18120 [Knoellia sinensis KCTC 19936]|uniref:Uncharacterized protein n=1 Tax=Knoellia sinensis KCTC 19936 TaxID=1385520 RepID=A0A0A0J4I2_9MICO|nr:hypothetical protein [Knoellia sinensis]KGN32280.1 hypothetical protein N802_18120 [Knoellia sinensis KCTC 19936]
MSNNPFVVNPEARSWHSGAGLLDSGMGVVNAINDESWVDFALSGVAAGFDVAATISDPLGSLFAAGIGWIIDHLDPIKGWFDDLTGNPEAVKAFAGTWLNVSIGVGGVRDDFREESNRSLEGMTGPNIEAYREHVRNELRKLKLLEVGTGAVSVGFEACAVIVAFVHGLLRDALSQIVGAICSYVAELVITLGAATPLVIHQATTRVSALASEIIPKIKGLKNSVRDLDDLVSQLKDILNDIPRFLGDRYSVPNHPNLKWRSVLNEDGGWLKKIPGIDKATVSEQWAVVQARQQYQWLINRDPALFDKAVAEALTNAKPTNVMDALKAISAAVDRQTNREPVTSG